MTFALICFHFASMQFISQFVPEMTYPSMSGRIKLDTIIDKQAAIHILKLMPTDCDVHTWLHLLYIASDKEKGHRHHDHTCGK